MKYFWLPLANSIFIFMMFMYIGITRDINTKALDKCQELELRIELQEKQINYMTNFVEKTDTIIVNVNYNNGSKEKNIKTKKK